MKEIFFSPEEHQAGLASAGWLFQSLITGGALNPMQFTTLVLGPDEQVYADCPAEYARFYGANVQYQQTSMFAFGSPLFTLGAYAANAAGNAAARRRAEREAMPQWREIMITRVVLTNKRFLISVRGQWLSFYRGGVMEFLPAPEAFCLILAYTDCEPLRLRGPGVPWISVALAGLLYQPEQLPGIPGFAGFAGFAAATNPAQIPAESPPPNEPDS